jgi:hypothetical protein
MAMPVFDNPAWFAVHAGVAATTDVRRIAEVQGSRSDRVCDHSRNAGPFLLGAIFALFPLYMLLFWKDLASTGNTVKQRAFERMPFAVINLSVQWCAISICVAAPVMVSCISAVLWFTYMKR